MKLSSFRTFLAFICSIGLISYVVAGSGASGDHGRPADVGNSNGPGFNQSNNPGQSGSTASDGTRFDSSDNPGKSGSAFGRDNADNASSNGSSHQNSNALDRGEKVIETADRSVGENESSEKSESSEGDKTFKASLMDSGLKASESPSAHTTPGQPPSGTPPGHHYGWEKGKNNPHRSSSPSATAAVSPSASASASASTSATVSATATATP